MAPTACRQKTIYTGLVITAQSINELSMELSRILATKYHYVNVSLFSSQINETKCKQCPAFEL